MLLTTVFQHFEINLESETDIRICKLSDAINHISISRLGYELERNQWVLKTSGVPATTQNESDKEAAIDIPPLSPSVAHSSIAGVGFLAVLFNYVSAF